MKKNNLMVSKIFIIYNLLSSYVSYLLNFIGKKIINLITSNTDIIIYFIENIYNIKYIKYETNLDKTLTIDLKNFDLKKYYKLSFYIVDENKNNNYTKFDEYLNMYNKILPMINCFDKKLQNRPKCIIENLHYHKNITELNCSNVLIEYFTETFDNIEILDCVGCGLKENKYWSNKLLKLNCCSNCITELYGLPTSLEYLRCRNNYLQNINLSDLTKLTFFDCGYNLLTKLDNLPQELKTLDCSFNRITELCNLPTGLKILHCLNNNLINLDFLPDGLEILSCGNNPIINLDNLPNTIKFLSCSNLHDLVSINSLPYELQYFYCYNNSELQSIGVIPKKIKSFVLRYTYKLNKLEFDSYCKELNDLDISIDTNTNMKKIFNEPTEINQNFKLIFDKFLEEQKIKENPKTEIIIPKNFLLNYYYNKFINWILQKYLKINDYFYFIDYYIIIFKESYNKIKLHDYIMSNYNKTILKNVILTILKNVILTIINYLITNIISNIIIMIFIMIIIFDIFLIKIKELIKKNNIKKTLF